MIYNSNHWWFIIIKSWGGLKKKGRQHFSNWPKRWKFHEWRFLQLLSGEQELEVSTKSMHVSWFPSSFCKDIKGQFKITSTWWSSFKLQMNKRGSLPFIFIKILGAPPGDDNDQWQTCCREIKLNYRIWNALLRSGKWRAFIVPQLRTM